MWECLDHPYILIDLILSYMRINLACFEMLMSAPSIPMAVLMSAPTSLDPTYAVADLGTDWQSMDTPVKVYAI